MKYGRPSDRDSAESWVSIWLGCMDARFSTTLGSMSDVRHVSDRNKEYTNQPRKRLGSNLHQVYCGHGFDPGSRSIFHEPWMREFSPDRTLGASPRERVTMKTVKRLKKEGR